MAAYAMTLPIDRSHIATEQRNPRSMNLHTLSVAQLVTLMNCEDQTVPHAVAQAGRAITTFIEAVEPGFLAGGRLVYIGAGTSGRLGVLDASEMPPTFQVPPDRIIGILAGGDRALRRSSEGKEDIRDGAHSELAKLKLGEHDTVLGIAAGATTPYVLGAIEFAKSLNTPPVTGLLTCSPIEKPPMVDHLLVIDTGPELVTGSTRMKAGTATKMTLNIISTTLMVRSGRVYQNLMVDLTASNSKLRDRAARIIGMLTGLSREQAFKWLDAAGGDVKTAIVMRKLNVDRQNAAIKLDQAGGRLGLALGES